jgi:hypothetical protein
MKKSYLLLLLLTFFLLGWGSVAHKIINRKITLSFPSSMNAFLSWRDSLAAHASDADIRKGSDPNEAPRHYIDIDAYPEFILTGRIPQTLDSLILIHGYTFVYDKGILPFAIIQYVDSIKISFQQHNWQRAMLKSADVGHYVADAHQPLHITQFYDGRSSYGSGIHSRYESTMIARDSSYIQYSGDSVQYVPNINSFVFNFIYQNFKYVDSVLIADSLSHLAAGNTNSNTYYDSLWRKTGTYTTKLFKNSSYFIACLIYTAWVNAGSPIPTGIAGNETIIKDFQLYQNYPNPFNPSTKIKFNLPLRRGVGGMITTLKIYNSLGQEIQTLVNEQLSPGTYEVDWNASNYPSGTYFYRLQSGGFTQTNKMMLIK